MMTILAFDFNKTLNTVENTILDDKLSLVMDASVSIAALCVSISLLKIGKDYLHSSTGFDWIDFFKPIIIFILVLQFNTLVARPLRFVTGVESAKLTKLAGGSLQDFEAILDKADPKKYIQNARDELGIGKKNSTPQQTAPTPQQTAPTPQQTAPAPQQAAPAPQQTPPTFWDKTKKTLNNIGKALTPDLSKKITESVTESMANLEVSLEVNFAKFILFCFKVRMHILLITGRLSMIMMTLIGPITFAISILPSFRSGIKLWIERYVQYCLWTPIGYMVLYVSTQVMKLYVESAGLNSLILFALVIACWKMIKQVPAWSSFIIESAGTEAMAAAINPSVREAAGGVGRIAGKLI